MFFVAVHTHTCNISLQLHPIFASILAAKPAYMHIHTCISFLESRLKLTNLHPHHYLIYASLLTRPFTHSLLRHLVSCILCLIYCLFLIANANANANAIDMIYIYVDLKWGLVVLVVLLLLV